MNNNKKVSVIVPIYNGERYLKKCLDTILCQTYKNIEIILVDDGSIDNTNMICEEYAARDKRCKVIRKDKQGVTNARKAGVFAAEGEYIYFVDCDDWLDENAVELLMEQVYSCGADIVVSGYMSELEDGGRERIFGAIREGVYGEDRRDELREHMFYLGALEGWGIQPALWAKLYQKELIMESLDALDEKIFYGEDAACLFTACLRADKIAIIHKAAYHYRVFSETSVTSKRDKALLNNMYDLYEYLYALFDNQKNRSILLAQLSYYMVSIMNHAGSLLFQLPYHLQEIEWTRPQVTEWQERYFNLKSKVEYGMDLVETSMNKLESVEWLFPFYEIGDAEHIVLYGAGRVGRAYYRQLQSCLSVKIVAWADENAGKAENLITIDKIQEYQYDYVVIAIKKARLIKGIFDDLIRHGVSREKIIWVNPLKMPDWYIESQNHCME